MDAQVTISFDPAVRASEGATVARDVLDRLDSFARVAVDCGKPSRMTPSFANGLIFTLMESLPPDALKSRVGIFNANASVRESLREAVLRYRRGVRFNSVA